MPGEASVRLHAVVSHRSLQLDVSPAFLQSVLNQRRCNSRAENVTTDLDRPTAELPRHVTTTALHELDGRPIQSETPAGLSSQTTFLVP